MLSKNTMVTLLINDFNILLATALAFFAICGVIFIIKKYFRLKIFDRAPMFIRVFCVAALLAFALEIVFFNYKSYLKYFADGEFQTTEVSPQDSTIILTTDSVFAKIIVNVDSGKIVSGGLTFKNLDRRVTSVFVKPALFSKFEEVEILISWTDEDRGQGVTKKLYKGLPHENHTAIQPYGKVSELTIMFPGNIFFENISQIAVNRRIPYYFSGLRLLVFSLLFFAVITLLKKEFRAKAAYYLFEYRFNPASGKQNLIYAFIVVSLLLFSLICVSTSSSPANHMNYHYSRYLVDAFIAGRVNLDFGHPEKLLNAEHPNHADWLTANGYETDVDWTFDIAYYNGKFYCYYGPVAAVLLYMPYKLITGNYLSHNAGIFVFAAVAVVLLALLWRFLVKKYMPDARFAFYILSFLALFFISHLFAGLRDPSFWTIVQVAGFTFTVAGIFLLLKSVESENINYLKLFFACLCFALVVGCRPNMVFASLLVPAVLWKRRSWKLALFVLIPFVMAAIPLCIYNYVRFDSIFEFGQKYAITYSSGTVTHLLNPLGKIHRMFVVFALYLFRVYSYSIHFPYVELLDGYFLSSKLGFTLAYNSGAGLINFPVTLCLLYMFKKYSGKDKPNGLYLSYVFLIIAALAITLFSFFGFFHGRYLLDCMIFIVLPSLFCAYYWSNDRGGVSDSNARLKIVYILLAASIFAGMCLFVTWSDYKSSYIDNPALYRYLENSLGIVERFI